MQERILVRRNRNLASTVHLGEEFNKRFIVYFYKFIDGRPTYTASPKVQMHTSQSLNIGNEHL